MNRGLSTLALAIMCIFIGQGSFINGQFSIEYPLAITALFLFGLVLIHAVHPENQNRGNNIYMGQYKAPGDIDTSNIKAPEKDGR